MLNDYFMLAGIMLNAFTALSCSNHAGIAKSFVGDCYMTIASTLPVVKTTHQLYSVVNCMFC